MPGLNSDLAATHSDTILYQRNAAAANTCTHELVVDGKSLARKFTSKELSKLNQRHNAHVAYRGKVSQGMI